MVLPAGTTVLDWAEQGYSLPYSQAWSKAEKESWDIMYSTGNKGTEDIVFHLQWFSVARLLDFYQRKSGSDIVLYTVRQDYYAEARVVSKGWSAWRKWAVSSSTTQDQISVA